MGEQVPSAANPDLLINAHVLNLDVEYSSYYEILTWAIITATTVLLWFAVILGLWRVFILLPIFLWIHLFQYLWIGSDGNDR